MDNPSAAFCTKPAGNGTRNVRAHAAESKLQKEPSRTKISHMDVADGLESHMEVLSICRDLQSIRSHTNKSAVTSDHQILSECTGRPENCPTYLPASGFDGQLQQLCGCVMHSTIDDARTPVNMTRNIRTSLKCIEDTKLTQYV